MQELHGLRQPLLQPVVFFGPGMTPCNDPFHDGFEVERTDNSSHESCAVRFFQMPAGQNAYRGRCRCQECSDRTQPSHWFAWMNHPIENLDIWLDPPITPDGNIVCWNCFLGIHPTTEQGIERTGDPYTGPLLPFTEWRDPIVEGGIAIEEPFDDEEAFDEEHGHCPHGPGTGIHTNNGLNDTQEICCECGQILDIDRPEEDGF